jgi:protein ImuB
MFAPQWLTVSEGEVGVMFGAIFQVRGTKDGGRSEVRGEVRGTEGRGHDLATVARDFSPRIEVLSEDEVLLDLSGLWKLFGDARTIAEEMRRTAADRGLRVRIAIAGTRTAARLMVRHKAGIAIVEPGTEAVVLAPLPLSLLNEVSSAGSEPATTHPPSPRLRRTSSPRPTPHDPRPDVFRRWGLRTCGELVALPPDEVMARLGTPGIEWQRMARGEDKRPLVPSVPEERFEQSLELEWPIDGLEPLSFVLGRLMEPLSAHLQQRDRGAAVLHVRLRLVDKSLHERSLELPAPMREARTLRTLALLDLESNPPAAAIDCVTVAVDPTPARVVQYSLLTRPLPTPETLSTLTARLNALMGETRVGSPAAVDSWQPGAFEMTPFAPADHDGPRRHSSTETAGAPATSLRRFRRPIVARVQVEHDKPVRLTIDRRGLRGGDVSNSAGPWRTSGGWWKEDLKLERRNEGGWDRDEWDVLLEDGATYRLFRERGGNHWFVDGVVD